jgi:hypothetical protein
MVTSVKFVSYKRMSSEDWRLYTIFSATTFKHKTFNSCTLTTTKKAFFGYMERIDQDRLLWDTRSISALTTIDKSEGSFMAQSLSLFHRLENKQLIHFKHTIWNKTTS